MIEPTGEREKHQCCCVFIGPSGVEDKCPVLVDMDIPFCGPCEAHQTPTMQPQMSKGWKISRRIYVKERN